MGLEKLGMMVEQPIEKAAGSVFSKLAAALKNPAIPEAIARGTAEKPALFEKAVAEGVPQAQRATSLPFKGDPALQPTVRATEPQETPDIESVVQHMKDTAGSFFRADPNLPKDIQQTMNSGRWRAETARNHADQLLREVYADLKTNPVQQAADVHDYLISADETAQALRAGASEWQGQTLSAWQDNLRKLENVVSADPEASAVVQKRRALWDRVFDDMVARGWTTPEHYLEDYTPIRKLHGILQGLASQGGEEFHSKLLNSMMHRENAQGLRETNLIVLESDLLEDYLRKTSEHEMFNDLMADRTVNFTEKFKPGDIAPKGLVAYNPGAGMVGYTRKSPEGEVLSGMVQEMRSIPGMSNVITPGAYVIPKPLGKALVDYHRRKMAGSVESELMRAGRGLARWLTVYNPVNTRLNMGSDLMLAMHGLPGERAHPIGILRAYPNAARIAYAGAFKNSKTAGKVLGSTMAKINGQDVDLWQLSEREGLMESTLHHEVANQKISDELARLIPETERSSPFALFDVMQRDRLATELAPRIAAGIEAWERSGDIKEFGRVGREITLPYGAGAPKATRMPVVRILSPFLQFIGLASGRVFDLLRAPESRNRTVASIMAVPILTWQWNTRNDEFKDVEHSLTPFERDQAHVILPDMSDPTKPMMDKSGKAVVLRFRYSVPEEVMKNIGLGNLAGRVDRVWDGRDTPQKFGQEVVSSAVKNATSTMTMLPGLIGDLTDEGAAGQKKTLMDKALRVLPGARPITAGIEAGVNYGTREGLFTGATEAVGLRRASVMRQGSHVSDADVVMARINVAQAKKNLRRALVNEGRTQVDRAKKDFAAAVEEYQRIAGVVKEEHDARKQP